MKKQMRIAATLAAGVLVCGALLFSGCEKDGANNSGKIDCYSINGQTYQTWAKKVYEYKNEAGEAIYTDSCQEKDLFEMYSLQDLANEIHVYKQKGAVEFQVYTFSKFVGWVTVERNYYFDVNAKTLDREIKFSEYKYEKNPETDNEDDNPDNKSAYRAIRENGYYCYREITSQFSVQKKIGFETLYDSERSKYQAAIYLDLAESGLSRHEYTIFSESDTITYRAKWF